MQLKRLLDGPAKCGMSKDEWIRRAVMAVIRASEESHNQTRKERRHGRKTTANSRTHRT